MAKLKLKTESWNIEDIDNDANAHFIITTLLIELSYLAELFHKFLHEQFMTKEEELMFKRIMKNLENFKDFNFYNTRKVDISRILGYYEVSLDEDMKNQIIKTIESLDEESITDIFMDMFEDLEPTF